MILQQKKYITKLILNMTIQNYSNTIEQTKTDLVIEITCLYNSRIPNTLSKWNDLQKLKIVLPKDVHDYYDNILHLKT